MAGIKVDDEQALFAGMLAVVDDDQAIRIRMCGMGVERGDGPVQQLLPDQPVWINLCLRELRQAEEG